MNLFDFYQHKIDSHALSLKKIKSNRNLITLLKLLSFGLTIWSIYLLFATSDLTFLILGALSLSGFVLLTIWDSKIVEKIKELEALIQCNQTEVQYLKGDYSSLETGDQYIDPTHPYSLDLDLFGEESLFQSINRTATHNGTTLLADWLMTPSIDKKEIECRLEATGELSSKIDWCQKFRAVGSVYPTSAIEEHTITRWQKEGHYFQNSWLRYSVYILNTLMLISGGCALMSIMSYKVALMFFFLQLFITVLSLKKINNLHNHLGHFIKTIGNYFYLVKLIDNEHFESIQLSRIKSELFKGNNSLSAFASLKKILGSFDQRSNVLVAALLNGLFMRDIHHAIKLDKWKTRYADNIKQWIAAVSETDALVS
ncbi:MAG: DNA mismatch repair protein MutS, partial [Bacteroidota bacterium]|nr:DNA mismatch repair protein MutS [Bacteroidota bacterium]